ncbi:MAG: potassium channel protein [Saprospiraceae bacterium]|nr:potassium channel protein [Saprospiraceae bacterium]
MIQLFAWVFHLPKTRFAQQRYYQNLAAIIGRLRFAVFLVLISVATGTLGYRLIEGAPWFDAYYMSIITLSTIGYEEVVPLSTAGRMFNSLLIVFNLSLFAYSISTITSIFANGSFKLHFMEFRMHQQVAGLRRHTIVCGFGRHAILACEELAKQQIPFVVIEKSPEKIDLLRKDNNILYIEGDATEDDILREAGIEHAAALVVTLPADANNLFVVLSARQINPGLRIISRANNAADEIKIRKAGADHVVIPEQIGGFYMATLVYKPDLVEFFNLLSNMGPGQVVFEEVPVSSLKESYVNRSIQASHIDTDCRVPIVAVRYPDGRYALNPLPEVVLKPGMHIVVLGDPEQMRTFRALALQALP